MIYMHILYTKAFGRMYTKLLTMILSLVSEISSYQFSCYYYFCSSRFLFLKKLSIYLFIYLAALGLSRGMQDLSSWRTGFSLVVARELQSTRAP